MQKTIFFFGFLLSYINIINYSFPLGIIFLFSTIFLNFIVYFLYKKFFYKLQEHFQIEKAKSNSCIICFDDFTNLDICELNCSCINKFYHEKCLKSWIEKKSSCPICRKYIE
jgi:hypothetical protein